VLTARHLLSLIAALNSTLALSSPTPQSTTVLFSAGCGTQAAAFLTRAGADLEAARLDAPDGDGSRSLRIPTTRLGQWFHVRIGRDRDITLTSIDDSRVSATAFTLSRPDCAPIAGRPIPAALAPVGTDDLTHQDLIARLADKRALVVYVWSPHMPLSVDGLEQASAAAASRGLPFLATVDPNADVVYAGQVAAERGWAADVARRFNAVELLFRGLTIHAPALTVVGHGLPRDILVGYRDAAAYSAFVDEMLRQ
jgi:hypothetical protein